MGGSTISHYGGGATLVAEGGKPSTEVFFEEKACEGTKELGPAREEAPKTFVCRSATGKRGVVGF